jgi:hypothetical protein
LCGVGLGRFWEILEQLKVAGARGMLVVPVEQLLLSAQGELPGRDG